MIREKKRQVGTLDMCVWRGKLGIRMNEPCGHMLIREANFPKEREVV